MAGLHWENLPVAFRLLFISTIPKHLKLALRTCSKALLAEVDHHNGVQCSRQALQPVALQECLQHLTKLTFLPHPAKPMKRAASNLCILPSGEHSYPCLQELVIQLPQPCSGFPSAACVPKLRLLQLHITSVKGSLCPYTAKCLQLLKGYTTLQGLEVRFDMKDTAAQLALTVIQLLPNFAQLQSLKLLQGQIQDEPLCEWLPRLRKGLFLSRQALSGLTHLHINFPVEDCLQLAHLTCLQQLSLAEEDPLFSFPAGLGKCTALLKLELLTDAPTASSHVQVLAKLVHLRELKLAVVCPTPHLASADLVALTACSALTALHVENFTLVPGALDSTAAAATSAAGGVQLFAGQAAAPWCSQTATAQAVAGPQGQLKTLRSLSLGDMGTVIFHAPVMAFAPQLTALRETSWWFEGDLAAELGTALPVDLDVGSVDALQGLEQLQVLDLDIVCLDRHAAYPSLTCLPCLCELQLEMCGTLKRSRHISAGLPHLPHLTKLLLYTKDSHSPTWSDTYDWEEDVLLWKHQHSLRVLQLNGSILLGAVMMAGHVQQMLPACLPHLQSVQLLSCSDLTTLQLATLVGQRVVRHVLVAGCRQVTDRDCVVMQLSAGGAVSIDFSLKATHRP